MGEGPGGGDQIRKSQGSLSSYLMLVTGETPRGCPYCFVPNPEQVFDQEDIMNILEAIRSRRSIRSFKPTPVPKKVLEEVLVHGLWSPSGSNTQPWEFAVLGGKVMEEVNAGLPRR